MNSYGIPVIDGHSHFPVPRIAPHSSDAADVKMARRQAALAQARAESQAKWRRMWGFSQPERSSSPIDELAERWIEDLDNKAVEKIVFVTGQDNDTLAGIVRQHPERFVGYAHHDPFRSDAPQELERAVRDLGLKGYKAIAPALDGDIADRSLWPLWERVEELGIPVLIHFGPLGGVGGIAEHHNINPIKIHEVAKAFPTIPIIIPHFGCGFPNELLRLCWACTNIYTDTSGSNEWVRWMIPDTTLSDLFRKFLETIGPDRIIFGTDSSWFPRGFSQPYLHEQLRICRSLNLSVTDLAKVFGGNISRLLGLTVAV